jgi:hypothetical protein
LLAHSLVRTQIDPAASNGAHCVPLQKLPLAQSTSCRQLGGQPCSVPLHWYGAQLGDPGWPAPSVTQVPPAQLWQLPVHATLQQVPPEQKPEAHARVSLHALPSACPGTHALAAQ